MSRFVLVGDVGGTNSRFALTAKGEIALQAERHYENARFASLQAAIETYFAEIAERADAAAIAIAGPMAGLIVGPTNLLRWRFSVEALREALHLSRLEVMNDFVAVARALPFLHETQTVLLGPISTGASEGNLAVLGPGTGLGVGALIRHGTQWIPVPSEGGHAEIGSPLGEAAKVHETIRQSLGRVSGEHVLSGAGLQRIDAALRHLQGMPLPLSAADIGHRALSGSDPMALEAVRLFFDYLARFSGDVALMFGAKGGVFLYGGVCQKLAPLLDAASFRRAFEAKSPLQPFLADIPTKLITAAAPGLLGCAAAAAAW